MSINLNKSLLLSVSVLLVLTSCGKSKELKAQPAAAQTPAPTTTTQTQQSPETATQAPAPTTAPPVNNSATNNQANQIPNNTLVPQQDQSTLNNNGGEILPPLPMAPAQNPEIDQTSVLRPPLKPAKPEEQQAYEINFANQVAVKTGGQNQDLFYTSAGKDGLMEEFKSYNSKVSKEQQQMNANLAKAIVVAKLSRSNSSGEVVLNLSFDEFGTVKNYRLKATSESDMMSLSLAKEGTTGEMEFQGGFLKCLDADGRCEVAYAKLKFAGGYTRVIFRNSLADTHFLIQQDIQNNFGFDLWSKYILNSANAVGTSQRIDSMQLSSFEVVNGRAGMGALLTTLDKEMFGLSIPLVVSGQNSEVNALVAKLSDLARNYDLSVLANSYSQSLSQKVNGVKLVNNNGLGQLKLQLSLGSENSPASIWMVVARVQKDIFSLENIRAFESKLKKF